MADTDIIWIDARGTVAKVQIVEPREGGARVEVLELTNPVTAPAKVRKGQQLHAHYSQLREGDFDEVREVMTVLNAVLAGLSVRPATELAEAKPAGEAGGAPELRMEDDE